MTHLPHIFLSLLLASCQAKGHEAKEAMGTVAGTEAVTDTALYPKQKPKVPVDVLLSDLEDAYNGFAILNRIYCEFEKWDLDIEPEAKETVERIDCSVIGCDSIRQAAQRYKDLMLFVFSHEWQVTLDGYNRANGGYEYLKSALEERYGYKNYIDLSAEQYWRIYDKSNVVPDYHFIRSMNKLDTVNVAYLKKLIEEETDFSRKCVYALEYAHVEDVDLKILEELMLSGEYSIYLFEVWRYWRCLSQRRHGASIDSDIPNDEYNKMRRTCANTILEQIKKNPDDVLAINQYLICAGCDDIYRYGEFNYGNQNAIEEMNLF